MVAMAPSAPPSRVVATGTRMFVAMETAVKMAVPSTAHDNNCPLHTITPSHPHTQYEPHHAARVMSVGISSEAERATDRASII